MNERIKELIEESKCLSDGYNTGAVDLEKFAELIVEEMYDFIMDEVGNDNGIPDLGKIREHFGVEQ